MIKTIPALMMVLALMGGPIGKADQKDNVAAMRLVIQTQLNAFARSDAVTAYAQASPEIHSIFPTTEVFMMMVRQGYSALIAPAVVGFLGVIGDTAGLFIKFWSKVETGAGGRRFTPWCNWTMPVGESAAVSWSSCLKSRPKTGLTSVVFTPYHNVYNFAVRICRQAEDDRATAHLAIFDIGVIAG